MNARTYRYFKGTPLFPFGYGLSYTTFSYTDLTLPKVPLKAGDPLITEVTVTNTGEREGDEVVQVYLSFPNVAGAPLRALRAFKRIHLKPGLVFHHPVKNHRLHLEDHVKFNRTAKVRNETY